MKKRLLVLACMAAVLLFSGCLGGYQSASWQDIFQKDTNALVQIEGFVGVGSLAYPTEIIKEGETIDYLANLPEKPTTGIPLVVKEKISCPNKKVLVKGKIVRRDVRTSPGSLMQMLDWAVLVVDSFECR